MTALGAPLLVFAASALAQSNNAPLIDYPSLPAIAASAKGFVAKGWAAASKAEGDLNGDGRSDIALALWPENLSTKDIHLGQTDLPSYRLVIAFGQVDGSYRLMLDNKTLMVPPNYSGAYEDILESRSLRIARGSLDISRELLRGHYRYRFRWSDKAFRLIGYEYAGSDGGCISFTSINYLRKRAKLEVMPIGEDRRSGVIRQVKRGPLPTTNKVATLEFLADGMGVIGQSPDCPRTNE